MDFEHFRDLALETLQRDIADPALHLDLTVREVQNAWVVDVVSPGRGATREVVPPNIGRVAAIASLARLVTQVRRWSVPEGHEMGSGLDDQERS